MKLKTRLVFVFVISSFLFLSFWFPELLQPAALPPTEKWDDGNIAAFPPPVNLSSLQDKKPANTSQRKHGHDEVKAPPHKMNMPHHLNGNHSKDDIVKWLLGIYDLDWKVHLSQSPWKIAADWVTETHIHPDFAPEMGGILREMATRKITSADVGYKGTQLKMQLTLEGGQKVAFKPKWYSRDYIITGLPYDGKDRHNGEIASFHLNRLLGFHRSPLMVGRVVNLKTEIIPVGEKRLLDTFFTQDEDTCFYGKCLYCKGQSTGVCADGVELEGVLGLWMPPTFTFEKRIRHPWARTYKMGKKAMWEQHPEAYCKAVLEYDMYRKGRLLMDVVDAAVFDYLTGNADRHHYEVFHNVSEPMLILLDSGKTFGNPTWDVTSILAPLTQCCKIRESTWERILLLQNGVLSNVLRRILSHDPIHPVLDGAHYTAMDRRLGHVISAVYTCMDENGPDKVLVKS